MTIRGEALAAAPRKGAPVREVPLVAQRTHQINTSPINLFFRWKLADMLPDRRCLNMVCVRKLGRITHTSTGAKALNNVESFCTREHPAASFPHILQRRQVEASRLNDSGQTWRSVSC